MHSSGTFGNAAGRCDCNAALAQISQSAAAYEDNNNSGEMSGQSPEESFSNNNNSSRHSGVVGDKFPRGKGGTWIILLYEGNIKFNGIYGSLNKAILKSEESVP